MTEAAWQRNVADEMALAELAGCFARCLETPLVIYLQGELGAGKTTFARACVHALGFEGYVKSPSYGLLETYEPGGIRILHLDLYRIEDPEELEYLAIRDLFNDGTLLMVEWPDRGEHFLPAPDLVLEFDETDEIRFVRCVPHTANGVELAAKVHQEQ